MKGIILANDLNDEFYPITNSLPKHLLPVYDKPMIYYPLSALMQVNIKDILIIAKEEHIPLYEKLLGDGSSVGVRLSYLGAQNKVDWVDAIWMSRFFIGSDYFGIIASDTVFVNLQLYPLYRNLKLNPSEATIVCAPVKVTKGKLMVESNENNEVVTFNSNANSSFNAFTEYGFYDSTAIGYAKQIVENKDTYQNKIEAFHLLWMKQHQLKVITLGSNDWFTIHSLNDLIHCSNYIYHYQSENCILVGSIDLIAYIKGWITQTKALDQMRDHLASIYTRFIYSFIIDCYNK